VRKYANDSAVVTKTLFRATFHAVHDCHGDDKATNT